MKTIGTRLCLRGHNRRDSLTKLCVKVLRRDLRLRERIEIGINHDYSKYRILIVRTVKLERDTSKGLAVDHDLLAALRIFACSMAPAKLLRSWKQQLKTRKVATRDRKIADLSALKH